jgi:sulfite exporter TauE/SafE
VSALVTTVFLASLLGSLHCAGMCGPFVAFAVSTPSGRRAGLTLQAAYHGGRLATYALLGAAAGSLGRALDLGGAIIGIQRGALALAGAAMAGFGLLSLLRLAGVRVRWLEPPAAAGGAFAALLARLRGVSPLARAGIIGLGSTLLPCGWLYAFAIAAAGTGSAGYGALTMMLFWLGTLPVLAALGAGVQRLAGPLRRHAPVISALALVLVGLVAVAGRFRVPPLSSADRLPATPSLEQAVARVESIDEHPPPCHNTEE